MITQTKLKSELSYDPDTGVFRWVRSKSGRRTQIAGCVIRERNDNAYVRICIDYKQYPAHRLAWLYMTGKPWPDMMDHINGDGTDNRWSNLRPCNGTQNNANRNPLSRRDLPKGVTKRPARTGGKLYRANICIKGQRQLLGYFHTAEEASAAYQSAAKKVFGEFARTS